MKGSLDSGCGHGAQIWSKPLIDDVDGDLDVSLDGNGTNSGDLQLDISDRDIYLN